MFQGRRTPCGGRCSIPDGAQPFEAFPSLAAVPCRHGLCPLAVGPRSTGPSSRVAARVRFGLADPSTSGLRATKESVACASALPPSRSSMLPWVLSLSDMRESCQQTPRGLKLPWPSRDPPKGVLLRHRQRDFPSGGGAPKSPCLRTPLGPANPPSEEGWLRRAREGASAPPFRRGVARGCGANAAISSLPEGVGELGGLCGSGPRKGWALIGPQRSAVARGQAPSRPFSRWASLFRGRTNVRAHGDSSAVSDRRAEARGQDPIVGAEAPAMGQAISHVTRAETRGGG